MNVGKVYLRGALTEVSSQRLQYKPYGYKLDFSQTMTKDSPLVFVELKIPDDDPESGELNVIEKGDGYVVLSLKGLNAVLQATADSLDELNEAYLKKLKGE